MDSRNVPKDIATGAGSFWLWFKREFDEKATISRGETLPSEGAKDPVVRRSNDDVTIHWSGTEFCQTFSLRHFNGGPSTSDLEKMARSRIAKREYPREDAIQDPVENAATGPPTLTLVDASTQPPAQDPAPLDLSATHEANRAIVTEGRPEVTFPPETVDVINHALKEALSQPAASPIDVVAAKLKKLDRLRQEYDDLSAEFRHHGLEVRRQPDGQHYLFTAEPPPPHYEPT